MVTGLMPRSTPSTKMDAPAGDVVTESAPTYVAPIGGTVSAAGGVATVVTMVIRLPEPPSWTSPPI